MIPADLFIEEAAFQTVHIFDLQQSLDIRRAPCEYFYSDGPRIGWTLRRCHSEGTGWLDAGWAVGRHPSDRSLYAFFGAEAGLHLAVTAALASWAPSWCARAWEATTISINGRTVMMNARAGLKIKF